MVKWLGCHINRMYLPLWAVKKARSRFPRRGRLPIGLGSWLTKLLVLCLFSMASVWIFFSSYPIAFDGYVPYFINFRNFSDFLDADCDAVIGGNNSLLNEYKTWHFDYSSIEKQLENSINKCQTINKLFSFIKKPLSQEEEEFPLAYGALVYQNIVQVLLMLSAFYHPQNLYCIAVSGSASPSFKRLIHHVPSCFPNINILDRPPVEWGSFEIINSTYSCMESLSRRNHTWKYYQYLSGVDVPLKTNLEMVKILKQLGEKPNLDIRNFELERIRKKNITQSPLPLFKSSLSAIIPRKAADFLVSSPVTQRLLEFLNGTGIPDESFWGTLFGNVKDFPVPGAVDGVKLLNLQKLPKFRYIPEVSDIQWSYYISREQTWEEDQCHGKMVSSSCVYGIQDIPRLMQHPALVAHKFYLDVQPVGFFCVLKEIRRRSLNPVPFDASVYSQLPQYELFRGISPANLTHPSWLRLYFL